MEYRYYARSSLRNKSLQTEVKSVLSFKNPSVLREFYCDWGLSVGQIAHMAGTSKGHVHYYMSKFGIDRRPWTGLARKQDSSLAVDLYRNQGMTLEQIARLLRVSKSTARSYVIREAPLRPRSTPTYPRASFSGDEVERAYLLGYRAGDVNAFQDSTLTVTARVSTTHEAMLQMFRVSFSPYGHCGAFPRKVFLTGYDWQIKAYLDNSFRFLIPRPSSPPSDRRLLYVFIAGLGDSDGCWSVSERHGGTAYSFDITSRNRILLERLASTLETEGYHPHVYLSRRRGTVKLLRGRMISKQATLTEDTWTFVIKRKADVKRLAQQVLHYSRHHEKIAEMKLILDEANEEWAIMGPKFGELRQRIRAETDRTIARAEREYKARHREPASGVVG